MSYLAAKNYLGVSDAVILYSLPPEFQSLPPEAVRAVMIALMELRIRPTRRGTRSKPQAAAYARTLYAKRRALGVCVRCGHPARECRATCAACGSYLSKKPRKSTTPG